VPIGAGTSFWLGEQNLNNFSVGEQKLVKNNQNNQIQNITLCSMYFSKNRGVLENFCVKSNFASRPPPPGSHTYECSIITSICAGVNNCILHTNSRGSKALALFLH